MICEAGDVAVVPFPFTDMDVAKARPALVISSGLTNENEGETVLAMITTASAGARASDVRLNDLADAGLKVTCVLRMKLFTLDNRLISRRIGRLSGQDRATAGTAIRSLIEI